MKPDMCQIQLAGGICLMENSREICDILKN